jgi:ribosome-binding factor A
MPLGGKDVRPVLAALERNKRYIRGEVAEAVNLKFAPDVRFLADETFEEADRISQLLASEKVRRDLDKD